MRLVHPEIPEILQDRIKRRHRHRSPHIHGVMKIHIHDFSRRQRRDLRKRRFLPPAIPGGHDHRSAPSHRPCSRIRPLIPIFQRKPELLLRRSEMAGSAYKNMIRKSALHAHGAQPQTFPHGRACSVKPEHWDLQIYISKRSGDELCQKIPRKRIPDFFLRKPALLDHKTCSPALKLTLRLFPAFLSQHGIQLHPVKKNAKRPVSFLLSHRRRSRRDQRRIFKHHTGTPALFS